MAAVVVRGVLCVTTRSRPSRRCSPLVHAINPNLKVCVFARGTGKEGKALLERLGVTAKVRVVACVPCAWRWLTRQQVIGVKKMEKKYQPYEMRRKLAGSYDLFVCDQTISKPLIPLCGKIFFQRHKMPLAIALTEADAVAAIEAAKHAATLAQSKGVCWAIKVGRTGQTATQVAENAINAANFAIARHVAGGWSNIQSINLKTDSSVALPVFVVAPRPGLVVAGATVPVVPSTRVDREQPVEDEDDAELRELAKEADIDWFSSEDEEEKLEGAAGDDDDDNDEANVDDDDDVEDEEEEEAVAEAKAPVSARAPKPTGQARKGSPAPAAAAPVKPPVAAKRAAAEPGVGPVAGKKAKTHKGKESATSAAAPPSGPGKKVTQKRPAAIEAAAVVDKKAKTQMAAPAGKKAAAVAPAAPVSKAAPAQGKPSASTKPTKPQAAAPLSGKQGAKRASTPAAQAAPQGQQRQDKEKQKRAKR